METLEKIFAAKLLKVKAIKLQPTNPFTWNPIKAGEKVCVIGNGKGLPDGNPHFIATIAKHCLTRNCAIS